MISRTCQAPVAATNTTPRNAEAAQCIAQLAATLTVAAPPTSRKHGLMRRHICLRQQSRFRDMRTSRRFFADVTQPVAMNIRFT
jgi:hypothetical protein